MNIEELKKLVGQPYPEFDEQGNYINCFAPIYIMYPNCPKFKKPSGKGCYDYAFKQIVNLCAEIPKDKIEPLDMIVFFKTFRVLHIGIYIGDGLILHCGLDKKYQIIKLSQYYDFIKGAFRYNEKK